MSDSTPLRHVTPRRIVGAAVLSIVAGLAVVIAGIGFDWGGFGGGLAIGVGIGFAVVGTYFWGYANGLRRAPSRGSWLPSRDGRR